MRQYQDIKKRWSLLFNTSIGVDLRQAIRDDGEFDPCEDGLRSVCWKSFLLNGPLSKATWTRKLKDSRSGYASLRDHFLRYIDNPNDLHSSADPLADDETSPWSTLRQDEVNREEIWQDVIRCNADNHFFQEPLTQRRLLDILFIYAKLNPDTGYRQGMHELLAPILWVVYQDSIDIKTVSEGEKVEEGADFMLNVLDAKYIEHDAFSLFCAVMQTAKSFYEMGDSRDSSAIVNQSERIHKEMLAAVDPDLSLHLQVVGIVPQIYAIRWLRLLFGRELNFKDLLKLWDALFAESLHVQIIDMSCVAILLRLRWSLIDADYTTAITSLSKLELPVEGDSARAIVRDAVKLVASRSPETGANIIQNRTGKRPYTNPLAEEPVLSSTPPISFGGHRRFKSQQASPGSSPARFTAPQKHLESLFSNVSSNFPKNTDGWSVGNVSKALRGAVGEARKNFEQLQAAHSRGSSMDVSRRDDPLSKDSTVSLEERLKKLEERNLALSKMLDSVQENLRKWKASTPQQQIAEEDTFNTALAKMQFVSVYLADTDIPIPPSSPVLEKKTIGGPVLEEKVVDDIKAGNETQEQPVEPASSTTQSSGSPQPTPQPTPASLSANKNTTSASPTTKPSRPTLAESSFSFMLGEDRHRSSFVRSTPLPEERRNSDAQNERQRKNSHDTKSKQKQTTRDMKVSATKAGVPDIDEDGFTMATLQ